MQHDLVTPIDRYRRVRPMGPPARLLLAEANPAIAQAVRLTLVRHGFGEPHMAEEAEEALDLLGGMAQGIDLVLMPHGPDHDCIDPHLIAVLRRIASPVRLACYGPLAPEDRFHAARLIGTSAYIDFAGLYGIARTVQDVLSAPVSVQQILATARVPVTLSRRWATAIYDAAPGESFSRARLETLDPHRN